MGIKRKHKAGRIREQEFAAMADDHLTRYQQAMDKLSPSVREMQDYMQQIYDQD